MIGWEALDNLWALPLEIKSLREIQQTVPPEHRHGAEYHKLEEVSENAVKEAQAIYDEMIFYIETGITDTLILNIILDRYANRRSLDDLASQYSYSTRQIGRLIKRGLSELEAKGLYETKTGGH